MEKAQHYVAQLYENDALLLKHYTCEIDPDDWAGAKLQISYEVVNFLLKSKYMPIGKLGYVPQLLQENVLSIQDLKDQITNAKQLKHILERFPVTQDPIIVYRGFLEQDAYFIKSSSLHKGQEIMMPYFLSTSINKDTAIRFTNRNTHHKCIWEVIIPKGVPLALLANGEQEVLINMGAIFECIHINQEKKHILLKLKSFSKAVETRMFWTSIEASLTTFTC